MTEYRWLRELSPTDRRATAELYARAFADSLFLVAPGAERWTSYIERALAGGQTLVAVDAGAIVGAISYSNPGRRTALGVSYCALMSIFGVQRGIAAGYVMGAEFLAPLPFGAGQIPYIELLAIDEPYRGQGHARALISALIERIDAPAYSIQVDSSNPAGQTLYESIGFREIGRIGERWSAAREAGNMERVFMQLSAADAPAGGSTDVKARTDSERV